MKIEVSNDALQETQESAKYYNSKEYHLGHEFLGEINKGFNAIEENPFLYSNIQGKFRRYLIDRFPFGIIYRIEKDTIYIIAIMHLKRRPNYWKKRI